MKCIYCQHKKTEVRNSREAKGGTLTWRRRQCLSCGTIFTTKESALADNLFVIKRNGSRQRFLYEKIFVSIFTSLNIKKGGDNGDNAKLAKRISSAVLKKMFSLSDEKKNIKSRTIISLVYTELQKTGQSYADHYVFYSDHRLSVALKDRLVKTLIR